MPLLIKAFSKFMSLSNNFLFFILTARPVRVWRNSSNSSPEKLSSFVSPILAPMAEILRQPWSGGTWRRILPSRLFFFCFLVLFPVWGWRLIAGLFLLFLNASSRGLGALFVR